jgi:hypothetical protein
MDLRRSLGDTPAAATHATAGRPAIDLTDAEWAAAPWRKVELPLDGAPPFTLAGCLTRLAKVRSRSYGRVWEFGTVGPQAPISREEAHFWLAATSTGRLQLPAPPWQAWPDPAEVARMLATETFDGSVGVDRVATLAARSKLPGPALALVVTSLLPSDELIDSLLDRLRIGDDPEIPTHQMWRRITEGIGRYLVPRLSELDLEIVRTELREILDRLDPRTGFRLPGLVAGPLGLHDELLALLRGLPDGWYAGDGRMVAETGRKVVLGLHDPAAVESEFRRLGLGFGDGPVRGVTTWLAQTGTSGVDVIRDAVLAEPDAERAGELAAQLARVHAPAAAPCFLELAVAGKAPRIARRWLADHQAAVVVGLGPLAGRPGRLGEAATEQLMRLVRGGHAAELAALLGHLDQDTATRVRSAVLDTDEAARPTVEPDAAPAWLRAALATGSAALAGRARLPAWLDPGVLPRLPVGVGCAAPALTASIVGSLARSTLDAPYPVVAALRANVAQADLDRFAWTLFQEWLAVGAPAKDKWAMHALGLLGGDATVMRLAPLVRAWPGESQHARAVLGLECLRAIGTDTALMQINGIAEKLRYRALKAKAGQMLERVAAARGLSRAELEDRIVPDCGLDERGRRVFEFGPRRFSFALGADLKPLVRDEAGKLRADLPKPGVRDDAALAEAAVAEWKLIRKQVRDVARIQAVRLEQAMVAGRRWEPDDFRRLLVGHPLMIHLVRAIVWGAWDGAALVATFRVTDEQDLAGAGDDPVTLDPAWRIGIVHPLMLEEATASDWGELLADYELIPPFPQLGRPIHTLEPGEAETTELTRFARLEIAAGTLVSTLERLGWTRGQAEDAGVFHEHVKHFPGARVTAVVTYPGVPMGMVADWEDQRIEGCFVVPDRYVPYAYADHQDRLPLGAVDPIVVSEVLADLHVVAGKAR